MRQELEDLKYFLINIYSESNKELIEKQLQTVNKLLRKHNESSRNKRGKNNRGNI